MNLQDILFFIVKLVAGTGVFLVGVHLLTENIEQLATNKIKELFGKTAGKKLVNVGIGALTTALIQSSGVTTVLIVGFVNIGIITLSQATAMIMGANIGTTITAQIAALSAFPITTYIQVLAGLGILTTMMCRKERTRQVGFILAGLGLIFVGLSIMSDSMKANRDTIQLIFENVTNPFLLFFLGIALTALVQSSSAITSVIIAMSVAGLRIGTGGNEMLFIILGTNIGSCVTALMSSFGAATNARRTSMIHLMFNTFGSVIFMAVLLAFPGFMNATFGRWFHSPATQIAMFHTFFNVVCTVIFLPASEGFVKISQKIIPEAQTTEAFTYLDERMLFTPALAIEQLKKETVVLGDCAMDAFDTAFRAFCEKDKGAASQVLAKIEKAQEKSNQIMAYVIKTSAVAGESAEKEVSIVHNNVADIMRIAEIADNFVKYTARICDNQLSLSEAAATGTGEMVDTIHKLFQFTKELILTGDLSLLPHIDSIEDKIDHYRKVLIDGHIERVNAGVCTPAISSVYINLVSNLERLGDHITYVAHSFE
ncbi:MAG: Na/Pi cotransporter family protein [Firmicutes bacterium]|nr:Na/Pi cotransporter family protein [Bacillota bacterium]